MHRVWGSCVTEEAVGFAVSIRAAAWEGESSSPERHVRQHASMRNQMVQQRPSSIPSVRQFGYDRKNPVEVHLRPDRIFLLIHPILTNLKPEPFLTLTMNPHGWPAVIQTTAIFLYQTLSLLIQRGNVGNFLFSFFSFSFLYGENEFPAGREAHLKWTQFIHLQFIIQSVV